MRACERRCQKAFDPEEAAKRAGAPPFKAADLTESARRFTADSLGDAFALIAETDRALKGSKRPPDVILQDAVSGAMRRPSPEAGATSALKLVDLMREARDVPGAGLAVVDALRDGAVNAADSLDERLLRRVGIAGRDGNARTRFTHVRTLVRMWRLRAVRLIV